MSCPSRIKNFALLSICTTANFIQRRWGGSSPHSNFLGTLSTEGGELSYDTSTLHGGATLAIAAPNHTLWHSKHLDEA